MVTLAYLWLPYMILPIYAGLERLPDSLLEASADLGARTTQTIRRVIGPVVVPAMVAGSISGSCRRCPSGAGPPLAAVTGRAEIMDAPHVSGLGGTYGGNPVACAAALAAIETIEVEDLPARARAIGDLMLPALRDLAARHKIIGDVRGRGAMVAIELVNDSGEPDPVATGELAKACHAEGMVVLSAGTYGNVLRFLPPLVMPPELLQEAMSLLAKVFDAR